MCEFCVNGWVNTIKFFVTKDDPQKIDLNGEVDDEGRSIHGKAIPVSYQIGEKCFCPEGLAMGSTDYVFQKSQIQNHFKLVDTNPMLFVDDRLYTRDILTNTTKRVKGIVLSQEQILKLIKDKYTFSKGG